MTAFEQKMAAYRERVRGTFRAMTDQALSFQRAVIVGGIDKEEVEAEIARRARVRIESNPCIHTPSRCNGGGYDGCACGPYPNR